MQDEFAREDEGVFMCTTKTGGVGLNLQTASYVILVDYPWTPGDTLQAEDRVYRIGQDQPVTIYRLLHGIDYDVFKILEEKIENINTTLDSDLNLRN
jgi:SNF2 family DNA or RNA helicase